MTRKEKILSMIQRLCDDDVAYDKVIYHLEVMREIEIGLEQAERGESIPHEEVFAELLADDEEDKSGVGAPGKRTTQADRAIHRPTHASSRKGGRSSNSKRSPKAKKPA